MGEFQLFRIWYYLRTGYKQYFAFIFAGLNMMVITYFLAIERAPFLKEIFPSFYTYAVVLVIVGVPILIFSGFLHYKRIGAYKSQQEVTHEANPFVYQLGRGYQRVALMPHSLMMSKLMIKFMTNQKITEDEIKTIQNLQKKIQYLLDGGALAHKSIKKLPFEFEREDSKIFDEKNK